MAAEQVMFWHDVHRRLKTPAAGDVFPQSSRQREWGDADHWWVGVAIGVADVYEDRIFFCFGACCVLLIMQYGSGCCCCCYGGEWWIVVVVVDRCFQGELRCGDASRRLAQMERRAVEAQRWRPRVERDAPSGNSRTRSQKQKDEVKPGRWCLSMGWSWKQRFFFVARHFHQDVLSRM